MKCRSCHGTTKKFFSLGAMPLVNFFPTYVQIYREKKFELAVAFCPTCYLVQLTKTISPKKLFRDYVYFSSVSQTILDHAKETAAYLIDRLHLGQASLVFEIASNDGYLLQYFRQKGIRVLGIDPAKNIAKVTSRNGIETIPEFFNYNFARRLARSRGLKADVVYGANVLAHAPGIVDFVRGVKLVLGSKGTAIFEFPYIKGLMENKFDTIYHEHVFYYSLLALQNLFQKTDLTIYDVEMVPMQGGSLRIFISHPETYPISRKVKKLAQKERESGFDKISTYRKINSNVGGLKRELLALLHKIKREGKTVAAYSAPAKGNVLLNYFGISTNYLDFIVDKAPQKQGLYTPGTHLRVYPIEKIYEHRVDYLLVLCWNIYEEVMEMEELKKFRAKGGKFIIPVPKVRVL